MTSTFLSFAFFLFSVSLGVTLCATCLIFLLWALEVHSRKSRNHITNLCNLTWLCWGLWLSTRLAFINECWWLLVTGCKWLLCSIFYPVTSSYPCSRRPVYLNRSRTPCLARQPSCSVSPHKLLSTFNIGSEDTSAYPAKVAGEAFFCLCTRPVRRKKINPGLYWLKTFCLSLLSFF